MSTNKTKVGEMRHKRTRNSKTWMNFDGSYTTEIHSGDVHFEDENGDLQNIDTDLFDEADFDMIDVPVSRDSSQTFKQAKQEAKTAKNKRVLNRSNHGFKALKVPFDAHIPRNFQRGYTIGKGQDKITFKPIGGSPSMGEAARDSVTYQDVWNDSDVELKIQPNGIKETIKLKTSDAPSDFKFEVKGHDIADDFTAGALKIMPAWLVDAEGTERDVEMSVNRQNDNKVYVELNADVTDLVYPVEIDPTVTLVNTDVTDDAYVRDTNPTNTYNGVELIAGYSNGEINRSLIRFDIPIPDNSLVLDAMMELYTKSSTTNTPNVEALIVEETWDEETVTWDNQPSFQTVVDTIQPDGFADYYGWDVKQAVQGWVDGEFSNNGILLKSSDETETARQTLYSSDDTDTSKTPKLTITYNEQPTTPTLITPNGGETWNAEHTMEWEESTDPEGENITYQIQLSDDNGENWHTIVSNATGSSHTYDFINETESSTSLIRIRAYDGTAYSGWDTSDGVFTIQHNQAPDDPSGLSPSGGKPLDQNKKIRLSWQHNDPNSGDSQSEYEINWRVQGDSSWNTIENVTTNNYYDAPSGTFPNDYIEWRVRTYDQEGLSSPWSESVVFFAGIKPNQPDIIYPGNNDVPVANPTVEWSSSGQSGYDLRILDSGGTEVYSHSGDTNKAHTVQYDLSNETIYELRLSITNADGLHSDDDIKNFYISYTPPAKAEIESISSSPNIVIDIDNPEPEGTQPEISRNDVYRRENSEWIKIAEGLPPSTNFTDYTPANDQEYEYYVRARGENGTYSDSDTVSASIKLHGVWLHDVHDIDTLHNYRADGAGRETNWTAQSTNLQFAGRKRPVTYFGDTETNTVTVTLQMFREWGDHEALQELVRRKSVVCYRDGRGRRIFGTITALPMTDTVYGYETSITVTRTSYSEEV